MAGSTPRVTSQGLGAPIRQELHPQRQVVADSKRHLPGGEVLKYGSHEVHGAGSPFGREIEVVPKPRDLVVVSRLGSVRRGEVADGFWHPEARMDKGVEQRVSAAAVDIEVA